MQLFKQFAFAITLCFIAGTAHAAALVEVKVLGSTNQAGPFTDVVVASPGQTVYYQTVVQLAAVGATNGTRTIATRTPRPTVATLGYDGIGGLSFTLTADSGVSFSSDAAISSTDGWTSGLGAGPGTRTSVNGGTNNRLLDVRPVQTTGGFAGANYDSLMLTGSFVAGSANAQIAAAYGTINGGFSYNSNTSTGANTIGNKPTIAAGSEPSLVSFASLTVAVPEPGTLGLFGVIAASLLMSRRKRAASVA